ncbi:MAG: B12-binding domain-containing protein [Calditrichaeota bacterium]|nr:B12-binding domain-containing protein [Calditrichota bacterium]
MKAKINYFNSIEAAKILGVNVSTIKRWTDEGKLPCVKSAGGHRKFMMDHLSAFLAQHNKKASKLSLFSIESKNDLKISEAIIHSDYPSLVKQVLKQSFACNRDRVQQVLNGMYLAQIELDVIYDKVITPVLYEIGLLWQNGDISVTEEHLASQTLKEAISRLQGIVTVPKQKKANILCLNFTHELHDIALKMVDNILETQGYRVLFSGQNTPLVDIESVFKKYKPEFVFISTTVPSVETQTELDRLCRICEKYKVSIFIGGRGMTELNLSHHSILAKLETYSDVKTSLERTKKLPNREFN